MIKTAIVTGGTRGIGRAIAIYLANNGYNNVIVLYSRNMEAAIELSREHKNIYASRVDITDHDLCNIALSMHTIDNIDLLVNNAGILLNIKLENSNYNDWNNIINTNLVGMMNVTRCVLPSMIKNGGGNIINIGSISGANGYSGQTAYGASKAGVQGFTNALAKEVARHKIRVNCINPGFIETDILDGISDEYKEKMISTIPLRRFGTCDNIVSIVKMLLENDYMTGSTIAIDGGLSC